MATIVLHRPSGLKYVVVGSGFAEWRVTTPSWAGGILDPDIHKGQVALIACAEPSGAIKWFHSGELIVVEVDGKSPEQWLTPAEPYR